MFFVPFRFVTYEEGDEDIYLGSEENCGSGDMNQDGVIDVLDIVALVNVVLTGTVLENCFGEMTADGIYNVLDIVALVNLILA